MKINIYILFFLSICSLTQLKAQGYGEWTWMKGNNAPNGLGSFGVKGTSSPSNNPPGLYEAFEWTDLNGNFWVFGGLDANSSENNALWKYDPIVNEWIWIHGSSSPYALGIYGTQGVSSPNNTPGARAWGGLTWTDMTGDLWLFGGYGFDAFGGYGTLNDLWKYNIATNQWTWMKGTNNIFPIPLAITGTKGIPNMANTPDGRQETNAGVTDGLGNLWMFGGQNNLADAYNDVWKYTISTNMWTWVAGNQSNNNLINYGVLNVSSPTNDPGDRFSYTKFIDAQNNLYFLGARLDGFVGDKLCDVWKFNTTTAEWTWVGGSNLVNSFGSYINKCDTLTTNFPSAKYEIRASWADSCGFFFFGGFIDGAPSFTFESFNDLWYYNIETNKFTWISGTNTPNDVGNYGNIGVSATTNLPPARGGALAFKDKQANLWLFGGAFGNTTFDKYDDLWRFKLDPNCGKLCSKSTFNQTLSANFLANTVCGTAPLNVDFINTSISATTYTWNFGDGSPPSNMANPSHTYTANGTYTVTLTAQGTGTNTSTIVKNAYIYVGSLPSASFITLVNDTVCLNTAFTFNNASQDSIVSNTWSFGDGLGATTLNTFHQYALSGSYTVSLIVKDNHNCLDTSFQKIVVMPIPNADFSYSPQAGCLPLSVGFTNNSSISSVNFLWNFGDSQTSNLTSPTHTYTNDGTFKVILVAKNAFGCVDTAKGSVIVHSKPNAEFTLTGYDGCFPYEVSAFANELGLTNYQWIINGLNVSSNDSISLGKIESNTSKLITLITTNNFGCRDTVSVEKLFTDDNCSNLYIPNVFTPNGDVSNNLFAVKALNYKSYHIAIYDRWGLKMFESSDSNNHWNGKKQNTGSECSDGTYFYIINVTDKKDRQSDYKGFLNLFK